MARNSGATKFASVNLNQSYGKQPQATASPAALGLGTRSRIPGTAHGGMLLLTRPTRPQPAGQKSLKLAVPRPVNLPSLRREHAGNDPTVSLVGGSGASGWTKQQQQSSEDSLGDLVLPTSGAFADASVAGQPSGSSRALSQQSATLDGELRPQPQQTSAERNEVYTPPGARTQHTNATPYSPLVAPPTVAVEKAVLLRGEDFPTLQASIPLAPAQPQQRQKELQQRQRDKQRELKEEQQKLQQLTQKHSDEDAEQIQQSTAQLQPVLSLQPQAKHNQPKKSQNDEKFSEEAVGHRQKHPFREGGRSLPSGPAPLLRLNHMSNWADDDRDTSTDFKSQEVTIKPQEASFLDWIDRDPESKRLGHSDQFGFRRPFHTETSLAKFGRNVDTRKGVTNEKENNQGWEPVHLKEVGYSQENIRDSSFGRERNILKDNDVGGEGVYGRVSSFGREKENAKSSGFGRDGEGFTRDDGFDKAHAFSRDGGVAREGSFGMDSGMSARDIGVNREMSLNKDVAMKGYGPHTKSMSYDRDSQGGTNGYPNSRAMNFDRENYGAGMGSKGRDLRESYIGMNGQNKDPRREREGGFNRDGYKDGFGGWPAYGREPRDGSFGRDGFLSRAGQNGDLDGSKAFNRFRNGGGRGIFQEFGMRKAGRGDLPLDSGRGRTARGMLYSTDPYTRAFTEFVGLDYGATSLLGLEISDTKSLRRKKEDVKESNFRDLERESFEAELERVQKHLEEDRIRKIEERERAIELERKEQEDRQRLAKEEEERQHRLEKEAREAAAKAEQEALEAVWKAEEVRRAREEERKQMSLDEERRKENARRKLLELEERIAKREADKQQNQEEQLGQLHRGDHYHEVNTPKEVEGPRLIDTTENSEEVLRGKIYSVEQDDDDRAPLRSVSSERPSLKFNPLDSVSSRISYPDEPNQQVGGFDVSLQPSDSRSSNNLELDQSRASSWRRGPFDSDAGTALTSTRRPASRNESSNPRPSLPRDHSYRIRRFDDTEPPYGSSYSYSSSFPGDRVSAEKSIREDHMGSSYAWRQNPNDDMGQMKYSNGHLRYSDIERGFNGNSYANTEGNRHRNKDKTGNYHSWEGRPPSPLSPPYNYGTDLVENSPSGRLRQFLPKQPRVPPPPLQAYQKLVTKSIGDHVVDCSTQVHHETKYGEQDTISREHHHLKSPDIEDLNHQPLSNKPQGDMQSSSSEQELEIHESQKLQHSLAYHSESSTSLENDAHPSTLSSKLESSAKPLVEIHRIRSEEEDSGEEGDEEMLEDSEAPEYDEEEVSYEEKGEFEEEEEEYDDVEEEKVIDYQEDEVQESIDGEMSSGDAENSKNEVPVIGVSEIAADPFEANEAQNSHNLTVSMVTGEELLESIAMKEQHKSATLNNDLQLHHLKGEGWLPGSIVGEIQRPGESSEFSMQPKQLQELITSSSSVFPMIEPVQTMKSDVHSSSIPHVHEQQLDRSTTLPPSTLSSSTPFQVPSVQAPLPSVQNHLDVPITLQFGLLPSTSLLPASIPAIQIGSIQMPLPVHMHSQLSPQVTHLHPSHVSPFQFGHLGHPIALSQLLSSFSSQAPPMVPTSVQNDSAEQSVEHISSSKLDRHLNQSSQADKTMAEPVKYQKDASDKIITGSEHKNPVSHIDSKLEEQNSVVSGNKENHLNDNDSIAGTSQHVASPEAAIESTVKLHTIPKINLEQRRNEDGSWQQLPGHLPTGTGNLTRGNELGGRERDKVCHLHPESTGNNLTEARFEGAAYHARSNRRNGSRRSEFRPRETFVSNERPASDFRQSTRERFGTDYNRTRSTNEKAFQRDSFKGEGMHERKVGKNSRDNSGSVDIVDSRNSGGKTENTGSNEVAQKNLSKNSVGASFRIGDLGKLSAMEDVPLQTGVVHVFEQPGIEIPGNGDDFIEVRSKRQMLSDRREQREKEIKAKSKAKEQVIRKQRSSAKQPPKGDVIGFKHSSLPVSEQRNLQGVKADAIGSNSTRLAQSGTPTVTLAASVAAVSAALATPNSQTPSLPPIISCLSETVLEKKTKFTNSGKTSSATGLPSSDGDVSCSPITDILGQDNAMTATNAWGGTRSSQQVVSLTQIQLEEVLKPVRYDLPLQPQLSLGEHGIIGLEAGNSNISVTVKERSSTSATGPIIPPLNGEKIQFGAVTSTYVSPISRPNTPSLLGAVGSSVAFRPDSFTETNELRKKLKQLLGTEDDVSVFGMKGKRNREDDRRNGGTLDSEAEAEAEAAASAVAVAAISNDDPVNNAKYGASQSNSVSAILNSASLISSNLGASSSSSGMMLGVPSARPVIAPASMLEDTMTVALPADLSVETHSFSLGGPPPSGQGSSGLLLPSLPSPFPGLDFGPVLGGHMFAFGAGSDVPTGLQGATSASTHEQGAASLGLSIAGWQQHVGSSDSFYGAPHAFAGPFMSPAGAVPNLQAPHHMLVYTNPFASIGQFGQLGVSFMGPTYIQSGKQPDWTHTPVASSSSGLVGMSAGELGGLGGGLAAQRNTSLVASPIQRLAPGPSVIPVTHPSVPFDLSREATFQIPTVEVSMQPQWSHVSAPHLQSMPMTGPLLGFSMQSRQSHGSLIPTGHLQHAEDAINSKHVVSSLIPVSASSFQSINASAQFPDELGLGDSISTSIPVCSYVGQQLSSKIAGGGAVSTGMSAVAEASRLQRGRRPRTARGVGMQGAGEGIDGSHVGLQTTPGNPIGQPASGGRSSPGHLQPQTQVSLVSPGQLSHHGFADEKLTSQLSRAAGGMGGWSGQGSRKVGVSARPQATERGISSEKSFVSSAKLKQVYVVKPSASYKRMGPNSGESSANMFVHEMGQTGISS